MTAPEDLLALLRDGTSPEELQRRLLSRPERTLLERLALVSTFDEALVNELAPDGAPPFRELILRPFVESVAGRYRLSASARAGFVASWRAESPELVALSRRLAAHFASDGLERLRHLLIASPNRGLDDFVSRFERAESEFDLAGCQDLLDVLDDRAPLAVPRVGTLAGRYRRYLDSRGLWVDEYFRTERFILPTASRTALERLLDGRVRTLDLYGSGGYGKTMHVRWLIARRCPASPDRIPCARIDFDALDVLAATREPHLLLLEIADQLNWQLEGRPYGDLLRAYHSLRERLRRRQFAETIRGGDAALEGETDMAAQVADIIERFASPLSRRATDAPVVLVFDTLEEALLLADASPGRSAAAALLELLGDLQVRAPALRLVFSGRYAISARVPALARRFPGLARYRLRALSERQARTYLRDRRGIYDEALIDAALDASRRVPFNLALIAESIAADPTIAPAEVRAWPADRLYLIERIVNRLPSQPLRWLLRYASIPRRLDFEFVRSVMLPFVEQEMSRHGHDRLRDSGTAWARTNRDAVRLDAASLWEELRRYVGDASWINPHPDGAQALQLQPEVVHPMRELLRDEPIVAAVHQQAAAYFEDRARSEPDGLPSLREVLFHRFQLGPDVGDRWWRRQQRKSATTRHALAQELAYGRDYDGRVPPAVRALARLALADSSLELAVAGDVPFDHPLFHEARQAFVQLKPDDYDERLPGRVERVVLGLRIASGDPSVTEAEIDAAEVPWLQILYARRLANDGLPGARRALEQALRRTPANRPEREPLLRQLVLAQEAADDLEAALATVDAAHAEGALTRPADGLQLARLRQAVGDFAGADKIAHDVTPRTLRFGAQAAAARAALARWSPQLVQAEDWLEKTTGDTAVELDRAALARLAAAARADLLDIDGARRRLSTSELYASRVSAAGSVAWAHLVEAQMLLLGLGHLDGASVALDKAERAAPERSEVWLQATLLRAELVSSLEGPEACSAHLHELLARLRALQATPRARVLLAVTGLIAAPDEDLPEYADLLAAALDDIHPPSARLTALYGIARCTRPLPASARSGLDRHAGHPWEHELADHHPRDRGVLLVLAAHLQRLAGHGRTAVITLHSARKLLRSPGPPTAARELLHAARSLGDATLAVTCARDAVEAAMRFAAEYPLLAAATIIEAAEASPEPIGELSLAGSLLTGTSSVGETWRARLELILAAQPDRRDEAEAHRATAAALFASVGDVRSASAITSDPVHDADGAEEPELTLSLALEGDRLSATVEDEGGSGRRVRLRSPLQDAISSWTGSSRLPFSPKLPDLLHGPARVRDELDYLLSRPEPGRRVRLRLLDAGLQVLPWELAGELAGAAEHFYRAPWRAAPDVRIVRTVQAALNDLVDAGLAVDGVAGPATYGALERALPGAPSLTDPRVVQLLHRIRLQGSPAGVLIAQPSREAGLKALRAGESTGAARAYGAHGFGCEVAGTRVLEDVLHLLVRGDHPPAVAHFTATLVPIGGGVAVEFSSDWGSRDESSERPRPISAAELDSQLRMVRNDYPAPLVVLEAITPYDDREAVNQLLMRNAFAAELFALGGARAVLATGLSDDPLRQHEILAAGLAAGGELGGIARDLRRAEGRRRAVATALWCNDPRIRLPAIS